MLHGETRHLPLRCQVLMSFMNLSFHFVGLARKGQFYLDVAQLVERCAWDAEAVGAEPTIQTN